tara:strand:- start:4822 stop:5130 length:309 start_codon:yes stop_codon:yes gene_type:complete
MPPPNANVAHIAFITRMAATKADVNVIPVLIHGDRNASGSRKPLNVKYVAEVLFCRPSCTSIARTATIAWTKAARRNARAGDVDLKANVRGNQLSPFFIKYR